MSGELFFLKRSQSISTPTKENAFSNGYCLYLPNPVELGPGETKLIEFGISVVLNEGIIGCVIPTSYISRETSLLLRQESPLDSSEVIEIKVFIFNPSHEMISFERDDCICKIIFCPVINPILKELSLEQRI